MSIFGQPNNSLTPTRPRTPLSSYGRTRKPTATLNSPTAPAQASTPVQPPVQGVNTGPTNPIANGNPANRGPMPPQSVGGPGSNNTIMPIGGIPSQAPQQIGSSPNEGINTGPMNPNQKWLNDIANRNEAGGNFYAPDSGGRAGWIARGGKPWQPGQPTGLEGQSMQNNPADNPILTAGGGGGPQMGGAPQRINPVQPLADSSARPGINTGPMNPATGIPLGTPEYVKAISSPEYNQWAQQYKNLDGSYGGQVDTGGILRYNQQRANTPLQGVRNSSTGVSNTLTDNSILTAGGGNNSQISSSSPNEGILPSNRGPMGLPQQVGGPNPINTVMPFGGIPSQAPGINTGPTKPPINDNNPIPMELRSPQQQQPQQPATPATYTPPTPNPSQGINTAPTNQGPFTNVNQWGNPEQGQGEDRGAFLGRAYDNNLRLGGGTGTPAQRAAYIANNGGPMSSEQSAALNPQPDPNILFNKLLMERLNAAADQNERSAGGSGAWNGGIDRAGWIQDLYNQQKNRARSGAIGI